MGGIAIALATIVGFTIVGLVSPDSASQASAWAWVLLAALAMFVVGFYDDRLQLSPIAKLVASLAIGAFLVFALAGAEPAGALPWSYTLIGTVWFAGMCHALNLLDNMDGLATGVAIIATAFLAALLGSLARLDAGPPARRARRRARRVSLLEPSPGAAVHGRLRKPVHRRGAGRRLARADLQRPRRVRQPGGARRADPRRAAVRHGVRAGAQAARRAQGEQGRHRSRLASAGVARLLRAERGADSVSLRPGRRH